MVRLKELILRSGFPLQIEISSSLTKHFTATDSLVQILTSAYYLDNDEEKGRELDIKVKIPIFPQKIRVSPTVFLTLLVQCKNIPGNAWVFFKSPQKIYSTCESTSILDALEWTLPLHRSFTRLNGLHLRDLLITNVYDEFVLDKNASNKRDDNLFEAIISLAKATSYEYETSVSDHKKMLENISKEDAAYLNYAEIFYSAVVFSGKMYLVEEVEKGPKMRLTPVDHVGLRVDYISGSYDIKLVVDILHKKAFKKYEQMIIRDMEILRSALDNDVGKKFKTEVSKAVKWHMSK